MDRVLVLLHLFEIILFPLFLHVSNGIAQVPVWKCGSSKLAPPPDQLHLKPIFFGGQQKIQEYKPFNALFLLSEDITLEDRELIERAAPSVNERLAPMIKGPVLKDIRFSRRQCNKPQICVGIAIPEEFVAPCRTDPDRNISTRVQQWNKEGHTMVAYVFVNIEHPACEKEVIASAVPCQRDPSSGRWTHGKIMFCRKPKNALERFGYAGFHTIFLHEMLHNIIYDLTTTDNRKECNYNWEECENITWTKIIREDWLDEKGKPINEPVFLAIAPTLRATAQEFFGCNDIEGIELAMDYNKNVKGWEVDPGHWSPRLFGDEVLHQSSGAFSKLSKLTLAAIKETGWYEVDMDKAEDMDGPLTRGCDVAKKKCSDVIKQARSSSNELDWYIAPLCNPLNGTRCSLDGTTQMICDDTGDDCFQLQAASLRYHPSCEKNDPVKDLPPGSDQSGERVGNSTMCVTFTSYKKTWHRNVQKSKCVSYACYESRKEIVFHLFPSKALHGCQFSCQEGQCAEAHENNSISYLCPNVSRVCGHKKSTDVFRSTTISTEVTTTLTERSDKSTTGHKIPPLPNTTTSTTSDNTTFSDLVKSVSSTASSPSTAQSITTLDQSVGLTYSCTTSSSAIEPSAAIKSVQSPVGLVFTAVCVFLITK